MATRKPTETITCAYITDVLTLQSEMLRRLSCTDSIKLAQIGEVMEEIGTLYLGLSKAIGHSAIDVPAAIERAFPLLDGVWKAREYSEKSTQD
jgi:hypothetical protein